MKLFNKTPEDRIKNKIKRLINETPSKYYNFVVDEFWRQTKEIRDKEFSKSLKKHERTKEYNQRKWDNMTKNLETYDEEEEKEPIIEEIDLDEEPIDLEDGLNELEEGINKVKQIQEKQSQTVKPLDIIKENPPIEKEIDEEFGFKKDLINKLEKAETKDKKIKILNEAQLKVTSKEDVDFIEEQVISLENEE